MIRLGINFHYPAINKTLVTAVFDAVCKLHFLVCKLCHGHVITIKIYEWFPKMMFYTWCKFQVARRHKGAGQNRADIRALTNQRTTKKR